MAVGLLSSDDIKIFTALAEGIKEDPESTIKEAIAKLPDHVEGYPYMSAIILADGMSGAGEEIALLASYLFDQNIRIVGGMAADDFKMEQTCVFCDSNIRSNALTICLFASKMPLFSGVKHGHTPLSRALKATRVKGNVLYEINNRPAWEVWKEETKVHAKNLGIDVDQIKKKSEIISFFLNYFDSTGGAPMQIVVVLNDVEYPLSLDTGTVSTGSYRTDVVEAAECRSYFFLVTAGNGVCYRYPATSHFDTYGEGSCLTDYD